MIQEHSGGVTYGGSVPCGKQTKAGVFVSGKGYPPLCFFIFVT